MTNIFLISPRMKPEDRFTAHWHYLLENFRDLAQEIVVIIATSSGIPPSKLLEVTDHPPGFGGENQPDFLFKCEDYELVCEHKLESGLGNKQLQRYCRAVEKRENAYLILIANQAGIAIPPEVQENSVYLSPTDSDYPYYLWDRFYGKINQYGARVTEEFAGYMDALGMAPWEFGEWGDPFNDHQSSEQFRVLWEPIKQYYAALSTRPSCRVSSKSLGMEVRKPFPDITQFYLWARKGPMEFEHNFLGRGMYLRVFLPEQSASMEPLLGKNGSVGCAPFDVDFRSPDSPVLINPGKTLVREYGTSLSNILTGSGDAAKAKLLDFVTRSTMHLAKEIGL